MASTATATTTTTRSSTSVLLCFGIVFVLSVLVSPSLASSVAADRRALELQLRTQRIEQLARQQERQEREKLRLVKEQQEYQREFQRMLRQEQQQQQRREEVGQEQQRQRDTRRQAEQKSRTPATTLVYLRPRERSGSAAADLEGGDGADDEEIVLHLRVGPLRIRFFSDLVPASRGLARHLKDVVRMGILDTAHFGEVEPGFVATISDVFTGHDDDSSSSGPGRLARLNEEQRALLRRAPPMPPLQQLAHDRVGLVACLRPDVAMDSSSSSSSSSTSATTSYCRLVVTLGAPLPSLDSGLFDVLLGEVVGERSFATLTALSHVPTSPRGPLQRATPDERLTVLSAYVSGNSSTGEEQARKEAGLA